MVAIGLLLVAAVLVLGGFYLWAGRRGLLATGAADEGTEEAEGATEAEGGKPEGRRVSLLTEAVAYIGAILLLAGGMTAIGQRWDSLSGWGHVGVFAGGAAFFLLAGVAVREVREPAFQRLAGVVWVLSAAGVGLATGFAAGEVYHRSTAVTVLAVGLAVTGYSAALWLARRRALQNAALFASLVVAVCGIILTAAGDPGEAPLLAFGLALWGFGLAWTWLGWRRLVEPAWATMAAGAALALFAPSLAAGEHGWVYAIGIATAAAAMAASVPLRNTPLLALGTLAMFSYVTSVVIRYFHDSLGVPGALTLTGALILGLAAVSTRLLRAVRPRAAGQRERGRPDRGKPPRHDLPRAA